MMAIRDTKMHVEHRETPIVHSSVPATVMLFPALVSTGNFSVMVPTVHVIEPAICASTSDKITPGIFLELVRDRIWNA